MQDTYAAVLIDLGSYITRDEEYTFMNAHLNGTNVPSIPNLVHLRDFLMRMRDVKENFDDYLGDLTEKLRACGLSGFYDDELTVALFLPYPNTGNSEYEEILAWNFDERFTCWRSEDFGLDQKLSPQEVAQKLTTMYERPVKAVVVTATARQKSIAEFNGYKTAILDSPDNYQGALKQICERLCDFINNDPAAQIPQPVLKNEVLIP